MTLPKKALEIRERAVVRGQEKLLKGFIQSTSMKQDKCRERILKYRAYQAVLDEHSFTTSKLSKAEKLEKNYSHYALQPFIDQKLEVLHPSNIRKKKNQAKFDRARHQMDELMRKNLDKLEVSCTRDIAEEEKEKVQVYFRDESEEEEEEEVAATQAKQAEKREKDKSKRKDSEEDSDSEEDKDGLLDSEESEDEPETENPVSRDQGKQPNVTNINTSTTTTKKNISNFPKEAVSHRKEVVGKKEVAPFPGPPLVGTSGGRHIERKLSFKKASLELDERRILPEGKAKGISAAPGIPVIRENSLLSVNMADEEFPTQSGGRGNLHSRIPEEEKS